MGADTAQLNLFGTPAPTPRPRGIAALPLPGRPPVALVPTPPSVVWAKMLACMVPAPETWIHVSRHWTGVILETLCDGPAGRWGWHRRNGVVTFPADPGCRARIVFLDPESAAALHARHPLVRIGTGGDLAARFRFVAAAEEAPAALDLLLAAARP